MSTNAGSANAGKGRAAGLAARLASRAVRAAGALGGAGRDAATGEGPVEPATDEEIRARRAEILAAAPVPTFWLLGRTGAGKSSIVRFLTGADDAEVGDGFRPCTRRSHQFDFPDAEQPAMRFLDTRGLGEVAYDPAEDLAAFDSEAHAILLVVRATDRATAAVIEPLRAMRAARPARPVILVITCLHEVAAGAEHPSPDPWADVPASIGDFRVPAAVPAPMAEAVRGQVERFDGLVDAVVPVDLTPEHEGFDEPDFGGARLRGAIAGTLPDTCRQAFRQFGAGRTSFRSLNEQRAMPHVLAGASMAAGAAAMPVPWVDIPLVLAIQGRMLARVARMHGQRLDSRTALEIMGGLAGRLAVRSALRGLLKAVPVAGSAANAAVTWAWTYGLGSVACWYYGELRDGNEPTAEEIDRVWGERMRAALERWRSEDGR